MTISKICREVLKYSNKKNPNRKDVAKVLANIDVLRVAYSAVLHAYKPRERGRLEKTADKFYFRSFLKKYFPEEYRLHLRVVAVKKHAAA